MPAPVKLNLKSVGLENNPNKRWLIKFDAATGAVVWEFEMPTNNSDGLSKNKVTFCSILTCLIFVAIRI